MGIGGSGICPTAIIAKEMGFKVSGCDVLVSSYYSGALLAKGINIKEGHDPRHLKNIDILAVTPAIFDISPNNPEIIEGQKRNILLTWQQFAGKYLQKDKCVISIAGTHGKSTTTVLMGLVLERGGLNPIVEAGAMYKPWHGGYRIAKSDYFVCEADEFNDNFLNYMPSLAIINNIEMDHPEYFDSFNQAKESFKKFIRNLKDPKVLVVNEENNGIRQVISEMEDWLIGNHIKVIGYYITKRFVFPFNKEYRGEVKTMSNKDTVFVAHGQSCSTTIRLGIPGLYNVANSLGVLSAALELGITVSAVKSVFRDFKGISRRLEFIGEFKGIKIFDDYAHHPTAVSLVIDALRGMYQGKKIWAIIEPHQISRLKLFTHEFVEALRKADEVVVTKIFLGREINRDISTIDMQDFIKRIGMEKAKFIQDFEDISHYVAVNAKSTDIIVALGAGNSYKLTKNIVEALTKS